MIRNQQYRATVRNGATAAVQAVVHAKRRVRHL